MDPRQKVELAQKLFREYRAACFWHCKPDLVVTEDLIDFVARGLRKHGSRQAFLASAALRRLTESK